MGLFSGIKSFVSDLIDDVKDFGRRMFESPEQKHERLRNELLEELNIKNSTYEGMKMNFERWYQDELGKGYEPPRKLSKSHEEDMIKLTRKVEREIEENIGELEANAYNDAEDLFKDLLEEYGQQVYDLSIEVYTKSQVVTKYEQADNAVSHDLFNEIYDSAAEFPGGIQYNDQLEEFVRVFEIYGENTFNDLYKTVKDISERW